ncbi:MAG TPA: helix-turn-helix transcriptional regulator [Vicinamibacterales bacterium]|nr:helix-turn-helix transcriptional regulator [Vicinamibacterales bacterium]
MKPTLRDIAVHLPLTPVAFEILLALAGEDRHGYDVMLEIERRTGGALALHPGTLYRAIHRLVEAGLVEAGVPPDGRESHDERRTYFRLTALGASVATAEAERLESQVGAARAKRLLKGSRVSS